MPTISAHYFQVCTRGAERRGVSRRRLLRSAQIPLDLVDRPDWRGSVEAMSLLVRSVWEALDDEHMGCTCQPVRSGAFAMMTEVAAGSATVLEALEKGIAFYRVVTDAVESSIETTGDDVAITVRLADPGEDPDHYFTEFWMIIWHRFACWLAGQTIALSLAEFTYPRVDAYLDEFQHLFPTDLRFGASACRLHFERTPLLGPVVRTEAERREMVARAPLDFMTIPASDDSIGRRVRRLLTPQSGMALRLRSLDELAGELGMRSPSLARALRREGTSLTEIVKGIRREIAVRRLMHGRATVEAIAADLDYAETRSFTRAFRQWSGTSPLRFRRNARG